MWFVNFLTSKWMNVGNFYFFIYIYIYFFFCVINVTHVYKFYVVKFIVTQKIEKMIIKNSYSHFFLEEYIVIVT